MVSVNNITGDLMRTKGSNDSYRSGWDRIFGDKSEKQTETVIQPEISEIKSQKYTHAFFLRVIEYERGYGQRIDGYMCFSSEESAKKYKHIEYSKMPSEVPDCYVLYEEYGWHPISAHVSGDLESATYMFFDSFKKANL